MLIALAEPLNRATVTDIDYVRARDDMLAALNITDRP